MVFAMLSYMFPPRLRIPLVWKMSSRDDNLRGGGALACPLVDAIVITFNCQQSAG
jgi:hypothetical protein